MQFVQRAERGFFPLDEELALLPGSLSPHTHENLVRLGAWMPFEKAAGLLGDLLKVSVSKSEAERDTERAGAAYVCLQTKEADQIEQESPPAPGGCEKMVFSADGAMIPLVHGKWMEVKTLVIGDAAAAVLEGGEWVVHTQNLSYFSRLVNSERFEHLTLSEVHRRGVENSQQVAAVMDGAEWLQSLVDYHCPQAVRILDFPHAGQRIGQVAEVIWGEASGEAKQWVHTQLHQLKHEGPEEVLVELRGLQKQHPLEEVLQENLAYLEKRTAQMQYPQFQQQGWPIGSGMTESGNKLVVEARLKGAGMHWKEENVDPMLALRNIICSDRWHEEWPRIEQRLRTQTKDQRRAVRAKHRQATQPNIPPPSETLSIEQIPLPEPISLTNSTPLADKPSERRRPAPNHPWRRSPIGKARYLPSTPAKN